MTELLETCVNGLLKSSLGVLVGMQMIRNLIAPALDSLRQMALWRTAGMIPGIGNADRGMSCGGRKRICDASASPSDRRSPVSADDCNPGGNFFLELV